MPSCPVLEPGVLLTCDGPPRSVLPTLTLLSPLPASTVCVFPSPGVMARGIKGVIRSLRATDSFLVGGLGSRALLGLTGHLASKVILVCQLPQHLLSHREISWALVWRNAVF